jgi:putative transcriptional regulator
MNSKHPESLQNNVSKLRTSAKQTQAELAEAVNVTRQTIIAIEKGNYVPSVLLAIKIAEHFNISVEKVFYV